jgi:hypothetical protein
MAIQLEEERPTLPPVVGPRGLRQTAKGMVVDKTQRTRTNREGQVVLNSRGKPAQEEVVTVLVLDGNTGTISGGDLNPDYTPEVGSVARMIFKGMGFGKLIDARKTIEGKAQVGDVITVTATAATIWRGAGDIAVQNCTDEGQISRAREKGLSVGWETEVEYRRATPAEAALVAKAEQLYMEMRAAVTLPDNGTPSADDYEPF